MTEPEKKGKCFKKKSLICCHFTLGREPPNPWCPKLHKGTPRLCHHQPDSISCLCHLKETTRPPSEGPQCRGPPTLSSQTRALDSQCHQDSQSVTPSQINDLQLDKRSSVSGASQVMLVVKNLPGNPRDLGLIPGSGRSPGEGGGNPLPTPGSLPGESHGQRSLAGYSPQGHKESEMTEELSTPISITPNQGLDSKLSPQTRQSDAQSDTPGEGQALPDSVTLHWTSRSTVPVTPNLSQRALQS